MAEKTVSLKELKLTARKNAKGNLMCPIHGGLIFPTPALLSLNEETGVITTPPEYDENARIPISVQQKKGDTYFDKDAKEEKTSEVDIYGLDLSALEGALIEAIADMQLANRVQDESAKFTFSADEVIKKVKEAGEIVKSVNLKGKGL